MNRTEPPGRREPALGNPSGASFTPADRPLPETASPRKELVLPTHQRHPLTWLLCHKAAGWLRTGVPPKKAPQRRACRQEARWSIEARIAYDDHDDATDTDLK